MVKLNFFLVGFYDGYLFLIISNKNMIYGLFLIYLLYY